MERARALLLAVDRQAMVDAIPDALWKGGYVLVKVGRDAARIVVGVTGHRVLTDTSDIVTGVRAALDQLRAAYGNRPLTVVAKKRSMRGSYHRLDESGPDESVRTESST